MTFRLLQRQKIDASPNVFSRVGEASIETDNRPAYLAITAENELRVWNIAARPPL